MKKLFLLLCIAALLTSCAPVIVSPVQSDKTTEDELVLWIATDIHYVLDKNVEIYGGAKNLPYIQDIFAAFVSEVKTEKPDYLIITGDILDFGSPDGHKYIASVLSEIEAEGVDVLVISGNHDFPDTKAGGFEDIYKEFGYVEAISRPDYGLSYMVALADDLWLAMIDTGFYGQLENGTVRWLDAIGVEAKTQDKHLLVAEHHPFITHNPIFDVKISESEYFRDKFLDWGVPFVMAGHIHNQDISSYTGADGKKLYDIVTGAMVTYPHNFGVITRQGGTFEYSTRQVDVENWARTGGKTDDNLLNFSTYSRQWYLDFASSFAGELPEEQLKLLKLLNLYYFMGTENKYTAELKLNPALSGLLKTNLSEYVKAVLEDTDTDDNSLIIEMK